MNQSVLGLYYEDFIVGDEINHSLSKTIFECDNNFFSLMTMNHHPVHTNIDYAGKNQHGKILVVGTLVFSLAVGITVPDISLIQNKIEVLCMWSLSHTTKTVKMCCHSVVRS